LGDGLRLAARCVNDDVNEAIEGTASDQFVLAVQWHPERTYDSDAISRAMFHAFIGAAADWHTKRSRMQTDFESIPSKH
jgi:putative glutamine amidotransferase